MSKSLSLYAGLGLGTAIVLTLAVNFADRNIVDLPNQPVVMTDGPSNPDTMFIAAANASPEHVGEFGLGRVALPEEVAAWDLDILPDGTGLPKGSGDVLTGEVLFVDYCAICHGDFAEGVDNWPKLAGGEDTLADEDPLKTVGSYWPYLSTTFDYVRRSMPFGNAQSLSNDEVYAIVAYILYSNYLVEEDFVLSYENFLDVDMPNADGFILDDRPESEYAQWSIYSGDLCMTNCKDSVEITMRAAVLDVTPEETKARRIQEMIDATNPNNTSSSSGTQTGSSAVPKRTTSADTVTEEPSNVVDQELIAAGEKVFKKCKACHQVGEGASNRSGPHLNGLFGRTVGSVDGFKYSSSMKGMGAEGIVWDNETISSFLSNPKGYVKGTKMSFAGLRKETDVKSVLAYLSEFSQ